MKHFLASLAALSILACGPGDPGNHGGTDSDSGSSSGEGSTGSSSGGGSTGSSSGGTGEACMAPANHFVPGCGDSPPGNATIEEGCYQPCDDDTPCSSGNCVVAWIDPCVDSPCAACGGEQGLCLEGLSTGTECLSDAECLSGVCWDFNTYDECCFGTVCSGRCESDGDCIDLANAANASSPDTATCGTDGRCDLVGTGLGLFGCAGGGPVCG